MQRADVAQLSALAGVAADAWPCAPAPTPPVPPGTRRAWAQLPDSKRLRTGDALRRVGWTGPAPSYLLVTVCAQRLPGWAWETRGPFPKDAALWLRRAAWALRDVDDGHPVRHRLAQRLHLDSDACA